MLPQGLQHHSQIGNVFVSIFGVNKDIIFKYHDQLGYENAIHKIHEGRRGIG